MRLIHDKGPATVVISSSELGDSNHLIMLASHRKGTLCVSGKEDTCLISNNQLDRPTVTLLAIHTHLRSCHE